MCANALSCVVRALPPAMRKQTPSPATSAPAQAHKHYIKGMLSARPATSSKMPVQRGCQVGAFAVL